MVVQKRHCTCTGFGVVQKYVVGSLNVFRWTSEECASLDHPLVVTDVNTVSCICKRAVDITIRCP